MATTAAPLSAVARVLSTTELLESILLQALNLSEADDDAAVESLKTILLAQGVNNDFQACITGSTAIQRRLGLVTEVNFDDQRLKPEANRLLFGRSLVYNFWSYGISDELQYFIYRNDALVLQNDGKVAAKGPKVTVCLRDESCLLDKLQNSCSSYLNMHLQRPTENHVLLEVQRWGNDDKKEPTGYRKWSSVFVDIKMQKLRTILELVTCLQKAAIEWQRGQRDFDRRPLAGESIETDEAEDLFTEWDKEGASKPAWEKDPKIKRFSWKKFLTTEQLDMLAGVPVLKI